VTRAFPLALFTMLSVVSYSGDGHGRYATVLGSAAFKKWTSQIDQLEKELSSETAAGEIAVARQWIREGQLLLREGKVKNAALIAERLAPQVELIRVVVTTGMASKEALSVEAEVETLEKALLGLKSRYDRLILRHGEAKTAIASPPAQKKKQ